MIVTGHDLPSPDEIAAKCVSPEAREEIIKKVHATKLLVKNDEKFTQFKYFFNWNLKLTEKQDRHTILSYNGMLKMSYSQMKLHPDVGQMHIAGALRYNFSTG